MNWKMFARLVIPGMIGGITGAYVLSNIDAKAARPYVMGYLAVIGIYLLWRAWAMSHHHEHKPAKLVEPLGLVGGFLDAAGGGGWGPIVTSNLLVQGVEPRQTIGTVNTAEFFLTSVISATFIFTIGLEAFTIAAIGLIIGGLMAAPLEPCLPSGFLQSVSCILWAQPSRSQALTGCIPRLTSSRGVVPATFCA